MTDVREVPSWVRYEAPDKRALIDDLQTHRAACVPVTADTVRPRFALMHAPAVASIHDPNRRAVVLAGLIDELFSHRRLTHEQQIIGRTIFCADPDTAVLPVGARRELAADRVAAEVMDRRRGSAGISLKQVEDREAKILGLVADMLSDPRSWPPGPDEPILSPMDDPYSGNGLEWVESSHGYRFLADRPGWFVDREEFTLRARRNGQYLWTTLSSVGPDEGEFVVTSPGHTLLDITPIAVPYRRMWLIVVALGTALPIGDTTTVAIERTGEMEPDFEPFYGVHVTTSAPRLTIWAEFAPWVGASRWKTEHWGTTERLLESQSGAIGNERVSYAVNTERYHHYRLSWS